VDQPIVIWILRALHILSGVFWAGSISLLARYIVPASRARAADRGALLGDLFRERKLGLALGGSSIINVLTGMLLYVQFYLGQPWNLSSPGPAEGFGLGGLLALVALIVGLTMLSPLRRERANPEDPDAVSARAARIASSTRVLMFLLVPATILMAIARYL
jgi:hypothetical protein